MREVLALAFEGEQIRALVARGGEVTDWRSATAPPDHMENGHILQPEGVGAVLRTLLSDVGGSRRRVVTSIPGQRAISRILTLPSVKPHLLEGTVARKARQEIPFRPDETYLSWQEVSNDGHEVKVYLVAVPREVVDRQIQALRAARIRPRAMDLKPLALVRAVADEEAIILSLEEHAMEVVVVLDAIPVLMRSVVFGREEADPALKIERLHQELLRTTKFYDERHRDRPLSAETTVYLTGALFDREDLRNEVSGRLPYPSRIPQPSLGLPATLPLATYCTNLGLALKEL